MPYFLRTSVCGRFQIITLNYFESKVWVVFKEYFNIPYPSPSHAQRCYNFHQVCVSDLSDVKQSLAKGSLSLV